MNYAGKFDAAGPLDGQGPHSFAHGHVDSFSAKGHGHVPAGAFVVPDPNLLFHGHFDRVGVDLVLSSDGEEFVVHDYFKGEKRAAIASPDGAHLTGNIVEALTGHVQVAQAAPGAAVAAVIGHVTKLSGSATVVRNGVSIILNNGDNVEKGDAVATGSDSTLGITFIDGTVFGLSANARMVLNEMVYDPNGSNNSSLLSLVAGTITFVAGETAKHGDMKVDTPVATMGIRGTAVLTEINFVIPPGGNDPQPQANFQVLVEPDGRVGSYILYDKTTLLPIATVNQAGQMIQISGGNVTVTSALLSPEVEKLISEVFTLKFTDNSNNNTKLTSNFTDTITPDSNGFLIKTASGTTALVTSPVINTSTSSGPEKHEAPLSGTPRAPGQPVAVTTDPFGNPTTKFSITERAGRTNDTADSDVVGGTVIFTDLNPADRPTVKINLADVPNFVYQNANHQDVTASLTNLQRQDIAATQINITVVPAASNANNGSAVWTYSIHDHAFDFLAAGETLTLTYNVRVDDNFAPDNEYTVIPITITIIGTNDAPRITSSVPTITFAGGTSVPGGPLTSTVATSGTLNFTDVDLTDTHTVAVRLTDASLPGGAVPPGPLAAFENAMSVAIANNHDSTGTGGGTIDWSLSDLPVYLADVIPKGETLTLTYTVTLTDSQGATANQTISVAIQGTDHAAVVWIATAAGSPPGRFWKDAANWETGTVPTINDDVIVITDQLHGLTPAYPAIINEAAFAKSVTMNDFGGPPPELDNRSSLTIAGALALSADSILFNFLGATIAVGGVAEIEGTARVTNAGQLTLSAGGDITTATNLVNTGTIDLAGGLLNLSAGIANSGGTVRVDAGATLDLVGATIGGGLLTNSGMLESTGVSAINHTAIVNTGTIAAINGGSLRLSHVAVTNTGGALIVDGASNLYVSSVSINGGSLGNAGHLYSVSDLNKIAAAVTNTGTIEVMGGTLGLAGGLTGTGSLIIDNSAMLELAGASAQTVTFAGGTNTLQLDNVAGHSFTGTITGHASTGGTFKIMGAGNIASASGDALDFTASGGTHGAPADIVLTPGGTLTGAANGVVVTQNGVGHVLLVTTGDITGLAGNGIALIDSATGAGDITVTNEGSVTGADGHAAIFIQENATGTALIDNSGTIGPDDAGTVTSTTYAIVENGGHVTINNSGAINGNISVATAAFNNASGGIWTVSGPSEFGSLSSIVNAGEIHLHDGASISGSGLGINNSGEIDSWGTASISGSITNNHTITVDSGTLTLFGSLSGLGSVTIDADATLSIEGTVAQTITFSGTDAELKIDTPSFGGSIAGFAATDKIDLSNIEYDSDTHMSFVSNSGHTGGVLTLTDDDGRSIGLTLVGDYSNANFVISDDGSGHTLVTMDAAAMHFTATPPMIPGGINVVLGSHSSDILQGSAGPDQFVFFPVPGTVQHTILDFDVAQDGIDLRKFADINAFNDLAITQQHNDTLIALDDHEAILLKNVVAGSLHASDFILMNHGGLI